MKVVAETGVYTVDEIGPGQFKVHLVECTCEDQTGPTFFECQTGRYQYHICGHPVPNGRGLTLRSIALRLGVEFSFALSPFAVEAAQITEPVCCRRNRIVEIIP